VTEPTYYKPGSFYRIDDRTGFKRRAEKTLWEWDGIIVDRTVWEPRQPQDFVRGVRDEQAVPQPRPRQENQFTILGTWVTAYTPRLQNVIEVSTTAGFLLLDQLVIPLDNGDTFYPYLLAMTGNTMTICPPLPHSVGIGIDENVYFGVQNTVVLWRRGEQVAPELFVLDSPCQDILDVDLLQ
jgi:hypothetical protein